ncbi:MAG TPA: CsgG/HfaB family protein, partial [Candidatus Angelobacter sp.]|nr:CsgG/HfaB family protein [Candidatus Angelobacter sp.]
MRRSIISLFVLVALLASFASAQQPPKKKRIAIMDFEYGTVRSNVAAIFGTDQDVGKGIADMLVDRLVNDGTYSVIERKVLDKLIAEQNFSNSDRADPTSAAKLGKLLGVSAIVVGSITQFGRDDKSTSGGAFGRSVPWVGGGGGASKKESKAVVQITARLVDVNTGEILASVTGKGESKRSGFSLGGGGGSGGGGGGGGFDTHSSNFGSTLIGEATNNAVDQLAPQLDARGANLPQAVVEIHGMVADVSGTTLILNVGASN